MTQINLTEDYVINEIVGLNNKRGYSTDFTS